MPGTFGRGAELVCAAPASSYGYLATPHVGSVFAIATDSTPGIAASRVFRRSKNAIRPSAPGYLETPPRNTLAATVSEVLIPTSAVFESGIDIQPRQPQRGSQPKHQSRSDRNGDQIPKDA